MRDDGARLRVTHVVWNFDGGGLESLVAALARRFHGTDVAVSVISLSGRVGRLGEELAGTLDQIHAHRPLPKLSMIAPLGLARLIRRTRADVVHLHSGTWYRGALAARLAGTPRVIFTEHGREHEESTVRRLLDGRAARWTDVVVAVSDRLAEYLQRVVGVPAERLATIVNGVDTEQFAPGPPDRELRARLGIPDAAWVIGSVGRLVPVKGYDLLLRGFAALRDARAADGGPPLVLVIGGDGPERETLERLARELGVADAVRLPGWVERPASLYRLLDVFALTSLSEGASLSLLEAMACGCAPVVSDVGASAELLGPELGGQVVPVRDVPAFARVAAETLASAERRERIGELARRRVVARYSLDRVVEEYRSVYLGRAEAPRSPARAHAGAGAA